MAPSSHIFPSITLVHLSIETHRPSERTATKSTLPSGDQKPPPGRQLCPSPILMEALQDLRTTHVVEAWSIPALVVSSAGMVRGIIKNHYPEFSARPPLQVMQKLSYNGLGMAFTSFCDKYWKEMRRLCILNVFSPKRVQSSQSTREDEVSKMITDISMHA